MPAGDLAPHRRARKRGGDEKSRGNVSVVTYTVNCEAQLPLSSYRADLLSSQRAAMTRLTSERVAQIGNAIASATGVPISKDDARRDHDYLAASTWRYAVTVDRLERAVQRP